MNRAYEKAIEENSTISEGKFKDIVHESFELIFQYLGKEKFLRWINEKQISGNIKKLVVGEMTKDEENEAERAIGFYRFGKNVIKLKDTEKLKNTKYLLNTNIHETYHFISDYRKNFPTFINEGLTEYLSKNTSNAQIYSYDINVDMVKFLHEAVGDSLIKAYLMGITDDFEEEFSTYISENGEKDLTKLEKFYKNLEEIHSKYWYHDGEGMENSVNDVNKNIENIAVNYIGKKAKNLEYYDDGKLNVEYIEEDLKNILKNSMSATIKMNFEQKNEFERSFYERALGVIIENSHLVINSDDRTKSDVKNEILDKILKKANFFINENGNQQILGKNGINIEKANELLGNSNGNDYLKIAKMKLENNNGKDFDYVTFMKNIAMISKKFNLDEMQQDTILNAYLIKNLPDKNVNAKKICDVIKDNGKLYNKLGELEEDRKKNTVESKFIKLKENVYLEKKDNQYYYFEIDREKGTLIEKELNSVSEKIYCKDNIFKINDINKLQSKDVVAYKVGKDKNSFYVAFDANFSKACVYNKNKIKSEEGKAITGVNKLVNSVFMEDLTKDIKNKTNKMEYVEILNDAENPFKEEGVYYVGGNPDKRSRKIDFDAWGKDIATVMDFIVEEDTKNDVIDGLTRNLLKRAYALDEVTIHRDKKEDVCEKVMEETKKYFAVNDEKERKEIIEGLDKFQEELNDLRRENISHSIVKGFRTTKQLESHSCVYMIKREFEEGKLADKEKKDFIKNLKSYVTNRKNEVNNEQKSNETLDLEYIKSNLKGIRITGTSTKHFDESIDIRRYIDDLRQFILNSPENKRVEFFENISEASMCKFFGSGIEKNITGEGKDFEKMSEISKTKGNICEKMKNLIRENVFENKEIDFDEINEKISTLHEISREEFEISKKSSVLSFENETVAYAYNHSRELLKLDIPEQTKKFLIDSQINFSNAQTEKNRNMNNLEMKDILKNSLINNRTSANTVRDVDLETKQREDRRKELNRK